MAGRLRRALSGNAKDAVDVREGEVTDDEEEEELKMEDVNLLPVTELKVRLRALGLKTIGNKATLRERLKAAIEETDESEEDEDDDDEDGSDEDEEGELAAKRSTNRRDGKPVMNTIREVTSSGRVPRQVSDSVVQRRGCSRNI